MKGDRAFAFDTMEVEIDDLHKANCVYSCRVLPITGLVNT